MEVDSQRFKTKASEALANANLRAAMAKAQHGFVGKRADVISRMPEFEHYRDLGREIKDHVLEHLDFYLQHYEEQVIANGGQDRGDFREEWDNKWHGASAIHDGPVKQ